MMNKFYKLDGKNPVVANEYDVGSWKQDRTVRKDTIGDVIISTVFLMIDHSFSNDGPPILFETMIFGGVHDEYTNRYATWDEAVDGHEEAIELVRIKRYKITGKIVLSFIFDDEQQDYLLEPKEDAFLESNENTVWYFEDGKKYESITTSNIIDVCLKNNDIEEIK